MTPGSAIGFLSYVRKDDEHEGGRLSQFRERLSGEVRLLTGEDFPIFQDRTDVKWGQNWRERIENSLDAATFLIPVITPGFFGSQACREELERFLEHERRLGRDDLILPLYYVNTPLLNDPARRAGDPLAEAINAHQYADWRELRFESFTAPAVGRKLAELAQQIALALDGVREPAPVPSHRDSGQGTPAGMSDHVAAGIAAAPSPSPKAEPPTLVVDAMHRGDATTISEAIAKARPGTRILVKPGFYHEALVIENPLEILGDEQLGDVVVQVKDANVITFRRTTGRVANLTLRQLGGGFYAVDVAQGRLVLEDCDITSEGSACVAVRDGADPLVRRNRIHDGKSGGVYVYLGGLGTIEDNDIFANASAGIGILERGNPTVRRNRIHDNNGIGVTIIKRGLGTIEDNDIFANALAGITIKEQANPKVRRNRIHNGKQGGVWVYAGGLGTVEDNDIFANALFGIGVTEQGNPTVRRNRINRNGYEAAWISDGGRGTFEDNDLSGNARGAWDISWLCRPNVKRSGNKE